MKARIYFAGFVVLMLALFVGWGRLVDLLPAANWIKTVIFFLVPAALAFAWPRKT